MSKPVFAAQTLGSNAWAQNSETHPHGSFSRRASLEHQLANLRTLPCIARKRRRTIIITRARHRAPIRRRPECRAFRVLPRHYTAQPIVRPRPRLAVFRAELILGRARAYAK